MRRSRNVCTVVFTSALFVIAGCSDTGDERPGPDGSADATPDTHVAPDAALATLTIILEEGEGSDTGLKFNPLPGASVAVDQPGQPRQEASTDASGQATFQVDWAAGPVDVIAAKVGYAIVSFSGLTGPEPGDSLTLRTNKTTTPASATISGTAKGGDSTATFLTVTASNGLTLFKGAERDFTLEAEAGKPSTILGMLNIPGAYNKNFSQSLLGWATAEWDGKGTTATVDLDFDNPLTPTTFNGEIVQPAASCLMASSAFGFVEVYDYRFPRFWWLGCLESRTYANNIYSYVGKYVTPKAATHPIAYYNLHTSLDWEQQSWVIKEGYPQDGAKITGFLCEPTLKKPAPAELNIPQKLSTKFEWTSVDAFERAWIRIFDKDNRTVWFAYAPAGSTSLSLPGLPSGFNLADLLGTEALNAALLLCAEHDMQAMLCRRGSRTKFFRLAPSF